MNKIKPQDHPDYVGGWVWTKLELDWINERIGTLEAALFQAQEAAKDLEARLTKTEGWLNEAMWNYGELKREQLANSEETSSSPVGRRIEMAVTAEREAFNKERQQYADWLDEAAADIEDWGMYAPESLQQKWDLSDQVQDYKNRADSIRARGNT